MSFNISHTHINIYCHQKDRSVSFYQNSSVWLDRLDSRTGIKTCWLKRQSKILPLSPEETSASEGNLNGNVSQLFLFTYIRLTATESSIHMRAWHYANGNTFTSLARELNPTGVGEHIYIYIYIYMKIAKNIIQMREFIMM